MDVALGYSFVSGLFCRQAHPVTQGKVIFFASLFFVGRDGEVMINSFGMG